MLCFAEISGIIADCTLVSLPRRPSLLPCLAKDAENEGKLAAAGRRKVCVFANRVYVADGFACFMFMRNAGSWCMLLQVTASTVKDPYNINNSSNCVVIWWNRLHILFCIYIHWEWNEAARQTYATTVILLWHGMLSEHVRKTCMWFQMHFLSTVCLWLLCEKKHKCSNIIINLVAAEREGVNIIDYRIDSFRQICEQCQLEAVVIVRELLAWCNRSWLRQMLWMRLAEIELTEFVLLLATCSDLGRKRNNDITKN